MIININYKLSILHDLDLFTYLVDAAIYAPFVRAALKLESVPREQGQSGARRIEVLDWHQLSKHV